MKLIKLGVTLRKFDYFVVFLDFFSISLKSNEKTNMGKGECQRKKGQDIPGWYGWEIFEWDVEVHVWTMCGWEIQRCENKCDTHQCEHIPVWTYFLTPRTTPGSLSLICQVQNTWSENLTNSGTKITWDRDTSSPGWQEKKCCQKNTILRSVLNLWNDVQVKQSFEKDKKVVTFFKSSTGIHHRS